MCWLSSVYFTKRIHKGYFSFVRESAKAPFAAEPLDGRLGGQPARGPHDAAAWVGAAAAEEEPADRRARAHVLGARHRPGHVQLRRGSEQL